MNIKEIKNWFELAIPNPTKDNQRVQVGVHTEEFKEMLDVIGEDSYDDHYKMTLDSSRAVVHRLAETLKTNKDFNLVITDRKELLDAICDQIVTAVGIGHMFGFDVLGALQEVSRSNNSKFVDGVPIFNENGKIIKGPSYTKPVLDAFLGSDPTL